MAGDPVYQRTPAVKCEDVAPPSEFLWVNEREEKREARAFFRKKQAFLKTQHHRKRREEEMQRQKAPAMPATADVALQKARITAGGQFPHQHSQKRCSSPPVGPILHRPLDIGVLEAFPIHSIHLKQSVNVYLKHYDVYTSKCCFPFSSTDMTAWFWKQALDQPATASILLSVGASHRAANLWASGAPVQIVHELLQDAFQLRSQTIELIQKLLLNPAGVYKESNVLLIAHLLGIEAAEGNLEAARLHADGLKSIVDGMGGLDSLNHYTATLVYCADLIASCTRNSLPRFHITPKWRQRVQKESVIFNQQNHNSKSSPLGARFLTSFWSRDLHPELKFTLQLFRQFILCHHSPTGFGLTRNSGPQLSPLETDCLVFLDHLLLWLSADQSLKPYEQTLLLSLLLYSEIQIWTFLGMPCMKQRVQGIQNSLRRSLLTLQSTAPDLLFWVLFITGLASRGLTQQSWFLAHLTEITEKLHIEDWDSAYAVLEEFFYVSGPTDDEAKYLWDLVLQRRGIRPPGSKHYFLKYSAIPTPDT
ncbi:uncharacterized protein N7459_009431 [Penicillium hispanicum]|uniref:uncharacterized protein n=1 Tax=Penicillium hispanicum TaxID=1080232 RepID=UPI0025422AE3|nr:uncharacterized protein N7459_009431 [Penicillium hispanicum]KAJ5570001.1 hypothetical protein N7459_009431 [Penicillium hispanicum]